ncbi:MAG: hypothetical protein J0M20_03140 [Burkholderiales bacterium]|nr:hypothetical protein [Burkholderiales bacterium]
MFHALSWSVVGVLLALWSLTMWLLHTVAVWTVSSAGALSGAAGQAGSIDLPAWIPTAWTEPLLALAGGLGALLDGLLQAAPALAGGLSVMAWVLWGLVSLTLLLLGGAMHLLISVWQRPRRGSGTSMNGASMARG